MIAPQFRMKCQRRKCFGHRMQMGEIPFPCSSRGEPIRASLPNHSDWFRNGRMTQDRPMRLKPKIYVETIGKEKLHFPLGC